MSLVTSGILRPSPIIEALLELPIAQLKLNPFGTLLMVVKAPEDDEGSFMDELEAKVLLGSVVHSIQNSWLSTSELPIIRVKDTDPEEVDQVQLLSELSQSPHCLIPLCDPNQRIGPSSQQMKLVVGRSQDCDIIISDPSVSAQHAEIQILEQGLRLEDLQSKNGTLLNGSRLQEKETRWLQPMDRIQLGRINAFVCQPQTLRGLLRYDLRSVL